ncbi:TPA: hypothetical protein SMR70_003811 [Proteus mirabilis]|nr:hypothetical protein [Proteus mirabilis]HEK1861678.1 hypothetical protein [Proteus mirabilis]HEK1863764.1 hypothetical protein [Proteus mirabilis]
MSKAGSNANKNSKKEAILDLSAKKSFFTELVMFEMEKTGNFIIIDPYP